MTDIDLHQMRLEGFLREPWGDLLVNDLLELMDIKKLLEWVDEPNEWFDNRTPREVVKVDGAEHIWDMIEHGKICGYS